jgi:hypothetical protein
MAEQAANSWFRTCHKCFSFSLECYVLYGKDERDSWQDWPSTYTRSHGKQSIGDGLEPSIAQQLH